MRFYPMKHQQKRKGKTDVNRYDERFTKEKTLTSRYQAFVRDVHFGYWEGKSLDELKDVIADKIINEHANVLCSDEGCLLQFCNVKTGEIIKR